jgi:hypothetical protein
MTPHEIRTATYGALQAMRTKAHDDARTLGYSTIDLDAVECEIEERNEEKLRSSID